MRIIRNEDLRPHIGIDAVLDAYEAVLREHYRGDAVRRPRTDVWSPTSHPSQFYRWSSMEGLSQHFGVFATRVKSDVIFFEEADDGTRTRENFNTRRGLHCGLIMVCSIETGAPLALVQDGHLQHLRVGAIAGLAAREGALEDASVVGLLGSGGMARSHLRAFDAVRDLDHVKVYSPTPAHRREFAREMAAALDVDIDPVETPREATRDAHIIACCTDASEPVLRGDWVPDGAFVTHVKSTVELADDAWDRIDHLLNFSPAPEEMRERQLPLDQERPHSYTSRFTSYAAGEPADYRTMPERPTAAHHPQYQQPLVQFSDVLDGTAKGRTGDDQVVSYGGPGSEQGIQFAAVGGLACEVADEHHLGEVIPNELLLETERD